MIVCVEQGSPPHTCMDLAKYVIDFRVPKSPSDSQRVPESNINLKVHI